MKIYNHKILKNIKTDHGFSLIEVMVALMLIALVFVMIPSTNPNSLHDKLEESLADIQRAVRFSTNESILKNSIVRITFKLSETTTSYYIEAAQGSNFFINQFQDTEKMSLSEREKFLEKKKSQDQQFQKISEFSDKDNIFPQGINIVGIGNSTQERIAQDEELYLYFYPSGEKDSAIIFFTSEDEMASLSTSSFEDRFKTSFVIYSKTDSNTLESKIQSTMKDSFNTWIKE